MSDPEDKKDDRLDSDAGAANASNFWHDDPSNHHLLVSGDHEIGWVPTEAGEFIGWLDVGWVGGPHSPSHVLKGIVYLAKQEQHDLEDEFRRARSRRKRAMRKCRYCGERHVPGHMYSKDVCMGCATEYEGVVY